MSLETRTLYSRECAEQSTDLTVTLPTSASLLILVGSTSYLSPSLATLAVLHLGAQDFLLVISSPDPVCTPGPRLETTG
jgi:hypothetical protein